MNNTKNIIDYGAVSSVEINQSKAIQAAIDACWKDGGGEVIVPEGRYLTGDIRLRSNITLHLQRNAQLIGSRDPMDYFNHLKDTCEPLSSDRITNAPYVHLSTIHGETEYKDNKKEYRFKRIPASRWNNALIRAIDAKNIAIIGEEGSLISGSNCFDAEGEEGYRGPHAITFFNCDNISLMGYKVADSANWAHNLLFCSNITADNITVEAGHDGFDASVCDNLTIRNSAFYTGDDCIAGFGNVNVLVENCTLNSSCSAMRFGGTNVLVSRCYIYGPGKYCFRGAMTDEEKAASAPSSTDSGRNNMLSAFTYYSDYSLPVCHQPGNIIVTDCRIENADRFLHYNYSGNETWQKNRPLKDITFKNIDAVGIAMPLTAYGDEKVKLSLLLENVNITVRSGCENIDLINACNFERIGLNNVTVNNISGECLVRAWSEGEVKAENVSAGKNSALVLKADKEFFAAAI